MSGESNGLRIEGKAVVARIAEVESGYRGGLAGYRRDASATSREDDQLIALSFDDLAAAEHWSKQAMESGLTSDAIAIVDAEGGPVGPCAWLEFHRHDDVAEVSLRDASERPAGQRFDLLSRSDSGLVYVRERRGGLMRVLTENELAGFSDPRPCPECAEQFGCEHYNCAGEALLTDTEVATEVPREWATFARDYGISRLDLDRLRAIDRNEGEYRLTDGASSDMRTQELVLLLNDAR